MYDKDTKDKIYNTLSTKHGHVKIHLPVCLGDTDGYL